MASIAVSAANFVYAPHASQAEIIFFIGMSHKSTYLCIVSQKHRRKSELIQTSFFDLLIQITIKEVLITAPRPRCLPQSVSPLLTNKGVAVFFLPAKKEATFQLKQISINKKNNDYEKELYFGKVRAHEHAYRSNIHRFYILY